MIQSTLPSTMFDDDKWLSTNMLSALIVVGGNARFALIVCFTSMVGLQPKTLHSTHAKKLHRTHAKQRRGTHAKIDT